jgi:lambda family phage portal protein
MLNGLRNFAHRLGHAFAPSRVPLKPQHDFARAELVDSFARAFGASMKDRTTSYHWGRATNAHINDDLAAELAGMRMKARFERQNNGILEGMVKTHTDDLVGVSGPMLQLLTSDTKWQDRAEKIWHNFWQMPDYNGQLAGVDLLNLANRQTWDCGEFFFQMVTDRTVQGPVKLRLLAIHPRRVDTPPGWFGDRRVTLGVRRERAGKPVSYFVDDAIEDQWTTGTGVTWTEIPATHMIHGYVVTEPNQARGIPRQASCLNVVAQLRDFESDVMGAARMAAMLAVLLYTDLKPGDVPPVVLDGGSGTDLERATMTALPQGYKATQINPAQPSNTYKTFRNEKLLEIGRPACMPLMTIRLDASGHNYSSARIDNQSYDRALAGERGAMQRVLLNRVLAEVLLEAQRAGALGPAPADLVVNWVWQPRPHVDETKTAVAHKMQMDNGTLSESGACAEYGRDHDVVLAQRKREQSLRDKLLIERVAEIQSAIDAAMAKNPSIKLTWAQVMAATGAQTAPAAYIEAAAKSALADNETSAGKDTTDET